MGEVYKKSDQAEREHDRRIMRDQVQKEKRDEQKEKKKLKDARERDIQVKKTLD